MRFITPLERKINTAHDEAMAMAYKVEKASDEVAKSAIMKTIEALEVAFEHLDEQQHELSKGYKALHGAISKALENARDYGQGYEYGQLGTPVASAKAIVKECEELISLFFKVDFIDEGV